MHRYRKILFAAAILLAGGVVMLVLVEARTHRTPLSVGATADEAWTYIHSPTACRSRGALFDIARVGWKAHAFDIQCDVRYSLRWPTNRLFATCHVVYLLSTNSTIIGTKSNWKWIRPSKPFGAKPGTCTGRRDSVVVSFGRRWPAASDVHC